jgi:hypothetical protein
MKPLIAFLRSSKLDFIIFKSLLNLEIYWSKKVVKLGNNPFSFVWNKSLLPLFVSSKSGTYFFSIMMLTN